MGIDSAKQFLADLSDDEGMAVKADDAYVAALHGVAAEAGFEFSETDLRSALDTGVGGLTEGELDSVVGGLTMGGSQLNTATVQGSNLNTATAFGANLNTADVLGGFRGFSGRGFSR